MSLSIEEMEGELAEFVPAREVMCGGGCWSGGSSYASNDHQSFNSGAGNGSNGFANGALSPSDNNAQGDGIVVYL